MREDTQVGVMGRVFRGLTHWIRGVDLTSTPPIEELIAGKETSERIQILKEVVDQERQWLRKQTYRRARIRAAFIPVVVLAVPIMITTLLYPTLGGLFMFQEMGILRFELMALSISIVILGMGHYFLVEVPITLMDFHLKELEERLRIERLNLEEEAKIYLREQHQILSNKVSTAFFDNSKRYRKAKEWLDEAYQVMEGPHQNYQVMSLYDSISELILREKREQIDQRHWQYIAVVIMLAYIGGLLVTAFLITDINRAQEPIALLGVPPSIVTWAATGSLAAILYRFYDETGRVNFTYEVRWLIARPIIGIIMGSVAYIALMSGLILLGTTPPDFTNATGVTLIRSQGIYWIIAFVAGFSDKFYLGIIDLLLAKLGNQDKDESGTNDDESEADESSPDSTPPGAL